MRKELFWDFDGTLYDTYPLMSRQFQRALDNLGGNTVFPYEEIYRNMKVCLRHACEVLAPKCGIEPQAAVDEFHRIQDSDTLMPLGEGMGQVITALSEAGFRHYLYTHRTVTAIRSLEADGLWQYFSDAVTQEDAFPIKPAPDALQALMKRNGLTPENCVMIGDRPLDVAAGHNAGMAGVFFDPMSFYDDTPAEARAKSPEELLAILKNGIE